MLSLLLTQQLLEGGVQLGGVEAAGAGARGKLVCRGVYGREQ
jgi:hypothetical protein